MAAISVDDGVISPGGVGYDINCGVRLVKTGLVFEQIKDKLTRIVETLFSLIPSGVGSEGVYPQTFQAGSETAIAGRRAVGCDRRLRPR